MKNLLLIKFSYVLLFLSFVHAILRLNDTSSFSAYRILMPVSLFVFFLAWKNAKIFFLGLLLLIIYNFIISVIYGAPLNHFFILTLHYISILNIFLITLFLYKKVGFEKLYNFLFYFIVLSLLLASLEIIFQFRLPNTAIYFDGSVSAFNWNQNELGTILLSFIPLLLVYSRRLVKISLMIIILYIVYTNDSKLVLIGMLLAIIIYNLKKNFLEYNKYIKIYFLFFTLIFFISLFFIPWDDIYVSFRDYDISLYTLVGLPISHILTLTPFPDIGGSDTTRANAIIYALTEFSNSHFLGIGAGNTLSMLEKPQYMLKTAKSIHNLPTQLVVENGIWVLFIYLFIFYKFIHLLFKQNLNKIELTTLVAIPSIFIGSMGSAIGIFSDYFFFSSIFLISIHYTKQGKEKTCKIT